MSASPELTYQVRRAHERREIALELCEALGEPPPEFTLSATLSENWDALAARLRTALDVAREQQTAWSGPYDALNGWRSALERLGVLVFQATGVDTAEMRAFSLADFPLPAIVVNSKDSPHARVFSMLHEFVHLVLREGGLCDLQEDEPRPPEEQRVEVGCNAVAGAILVPVEQLLREDLVRAKRAGQVWSDEDLALLSRRYGASREVILRRLLATGRITREFYRAWRQEALKHMASQPQRPQGFAHPQAKAVSSAGHLFVRLVLNSYYQGRITARDVSDFLDVRLRHMGQVERAVLGRTVEFGAVA